MRNTAHNTFQEDIIMEEKMFKAASVTGIMNLVLGVTILVSAITWGVLLLVSGGKLLKSKKDVII